MKIPTALTTAGGGFKAMTIGMGFMRAFHEQGLLSEMTHFGAVSGGSWMQAQLSYSRDFYRSVVGIETFKTVREVVAEWGERYAMSMDQAVQEARLEDWTFRISEQSYLCVIDTIDVGNETLDVLWEDFFNSLEFDTRWPASDWYFYISNMLDPYIADVTTTPFDAPREGLPNGILVLGLTLPPDVWDNTAISTPVLDEIPVDFIPLAYHAPPGQVGEWKLPSTVPNPLQVSEGIGLDKTTVDLDLNPSAGIAEVCAGSSSAGGVAGSPKLMEASMANSIDGLNISSSEKILLKQAIDACLPLGLQNISAPTDGDFPSTTSPWTPKFRYLDGAYSDGSSVAQTIARMQEDCASGNPEFDCSNGIRVYQIFDGTRGQFLTIPRLFANCNCPLKGSTIGTGFSPQLFAEDYPADDDPGWYLYSNATYDFAPPFGTASDIESWVWRGTVTTVDNPNFGITAGTKVDFICFFTAFPPQEFEIWPGFGAGYAFSVLYGVIAQEQFEGAKLALEVLGTNETTSSPTPAPSDGEGGGSVDIPTAYTTSGGGFSSLTFSMGFMRAFYDEGVLPSISYWGGVSGGSWFQVQFSYSQSFYESVVGINTRESVRQVVSKWGIDYGNSMDEAIQLAVLNDWRFTVGDTNFLCIADTIQIGNETLDQVWENLFNTIEYGARFPASDWYFYNVYMLLPTLPDVVTTPFDSPRLGWPNGTIVIGATLPPDVFDNTGSKTPSLDDIPVDYIPIAFISELGKTPEWKTPQNAPNPLQVSQGIAFSKTTVDLALNPNAAIAEVAAGSSSAGGILGSPTLMKDSVQEAVFNPNLNLTMSERILLNNAIDFCLPLGLQNSSAPTDGDFPSPSSPWSPRYRYLDGGFSEVTTVAHTISKMQNDCDDPSLGMDCSNGLRVYQMFEGGRGEFLNVPRLFANCNCPFNDTESRYSIQIFAEDYPSDDDPGWTLYSNATYTFDEPFGTAEGVESWVWRGNVTTVENVAYNVSAGTQVEFICFFAKRPPQTYFIWPGFAANYAFSEIFGVIAEVQSDSVQALLAEWNMGEIGMGTPTMPPTNSMMPSTSSPTSSPTAAPSPAPTPMPTAAPTPGGGSPTTSPPTPGAQGTDVPTGAPTSGSSRSSGAYGACLAFVSIGYILLLA